MAGGIHSLESIPGHLKRLKIRALSSAGFSIELRTAFILGINRLVASEAHISLKNMILPSFQVLHNSYFKPI